MINRKVNFGDREIEYKIKKSARSRNLRLSIHCDASVVVSAPTYFADSKIEKFLQEKAEWILAKVDHFLSLPKKTSIVGGRKEFKINKAKALHFVRDKIAKINAVYNFSVGKVMIKDQKSRWGSCSKKGNLNFNYKIALLPERLGEYVVAHELCHLKEFNHSRKFWKLVSVTIPDYKLCVRKLRKEVSLR